MVQTIKENIWNYLKKILTFIQDYPLICTLIFIIIYEYLSIENMLISSFSVILFLLLLENQNNNFFKLKNLKFKLKKNPNIDIISKPRNNLLIAKFSFKKKKYYICDVIKDLKTKESRLTVISPSDNEIVAELFAPNLYITKDKVLAYLDENLENIL